MNRFEVIVRENERNGSEWRQSDEAFDAPIEFEISGDDRPLIPAGVYEAMYIRHEKQKYFTQLKLYLYLSITSIGQYQSTVLVRAYNFDKPLKRGSDLRRDLALITGRRLTNKSRFSSEVFKKKVFKVKVRTVTKDRKGNLLGPYREYSIVDSILEVLEG